MSDPSKHGDPGAHSEAHSDHEPVRQATRRYAGYAALRKLRRMVDQDAAVREADRRFVSRFLTGFGLVLFGAILAWFWFRGFM
jgi:hypothetical protein